MLGPYELLDKVMEFAKNQFDKGQTKILKTDLQNHIKEIDPNADSRNLELVINELDARGWLLKNSKTEIKFDPSSFE